MKCSLCFAIVIMMVQICNAVTIKVPNHQPTIQAGIDAAANGDTILVAHGTYTGEGNRDLVTYGKNILLKSEHGYMYTIIDCEGTEADPHRGINFIHGEDSSFIFDGFTIVGGHAPEDATRGACGGAVLCEFSSPQILNCKFYGNSASKGGALYLYYSDTKIAHTIIDSNIAYHGGGVKSWISNFEVSFSLFTRNSANSVVAGGGGIHCHKGSPKILNCSFLYNSAIYGGGIDYFSVDDAAIINSIIYHNYAQNGSGIWHGKGIACCNIYGNIGGEGSFCDDCISVYPEFCDTIFDNYYLKPISECLPDNNSCVVLMGCYGEGCFSPSCGDVNFDYVVNVSDAVWIINYVFAGGPPPNPMDSGDVNCGGSVNVSDAVWIINYVFVNGFTPCDIDGDDVEDC